MPDLTVGKLKQILANIKDNSMPVVLEGSDHSYIEAGGAYKCKAEILPCDAGHGGLLSEFHGEEHLSNGAGVTHVFLIRSW